MPQKISPADAFLQAMRFRFACKEFDPTRTISRQQFAVILEAARLSPSAFGLEPWQFLVVQNTSLREKLRAVTWGGQTQLLSCSHYVVILARKASAMQVESPHVQYMVQEIKQLPEDIRDAFAGRYREFKDKDFALTGNDRAGFEWACRQCYIALANMMAAAAFMKIDSCAIEGFNKELCEQLMVAENLMDGNEFGVACMAAFGFRKNPPKRPSSRQPLDRVMHWIE